VSGCGEFVVAVRLFAAAREAAGVARDVVSVGAGATVGAVLDVACARYGSDFASVLATSRVWVNGVEAAAADPVRPDDEVAVLPPVSGGAGG
jgi:molybdopterin converting factor small subunit